MSNVITSIHGHNVYPNDNINCVCIDFDYWGKPATLQIPYAAYRPAEIVRYCYEYGFIGIPHIDQDPWYLAEKYVHADVSIPLVPDYILREKFKDFKDDGTGSRNTDVLINHSSPAARFCRDLEVPGLSKGYFDLGNLYETAILWLESDTIDAVDPTAKDYPERMLGMYNPNGRFYNGGAGALWTSSDYNYDTAWYINFLGYVINRYKCNYYSVVPSRVVMRDKASEFIKTPTHPSAIVAPAEMREPKNGYDSDLELK